MLHPGLDGRGGVTGENAFPLLPFPPAPFQHLLDDLIGLKPHVPALLTLKNCTHKPLIFELG